MTLNSSRAILALLPGAVPAVAKAVADLIHDESGESAAAQTAATLERLEQRVRVLSQNSSNSRRISGTRVVVLEYILQVAVAQLWESPEVEDVMAHCGLSVEEVVEAYEDLETTDLVHLDGNLNHPSGYARARLQDSAYLRVASELLPGIPVFGELRRVLAHLKDAGGRATTSALIAESAIPIARLNVLLSAMIAYGLVSGSGPGDPRWGQFMDICLEPQGRRVLRRDDPLPDTAV